jgi:replicative DNA helicase
LADANERFSREPFNIDDTSSLSAARLASAVRRAIRRKGIELVIIDYLQLMYPENERCPREEQVGTLAKRAKQLARQCKIPVLLLAQLNRQSEGRADRRPRLADLRESGQIECHADVVMLLHPQVDPTTTTEPSVTTDVLIEKNRNGPVGVVSLEYRRGITRFENAAIR